MEHATFEAWEAYFECYCIQTETKVIEHALTSATTLLVTIVKHLELFGKWNPALGL
jgi:hypothetical protein